ncbi:hypothetical protein ND860_17965 [Leptospira levettii]|uniref:hypothetical protein n=1 Tax=Leptospira levettii TaxID=2023178 RepID=UPI00223E88C9|nr:hypothetical protein [Leptospira levettii]MCW7498428.1 hypothetical protein [Leptospira levettii]
MKIIVKILLLLCTLNFMGCTQTSGISNNTLISLKDADAEFTKVFFLKQIENFPSFASYTPVTLYTGDCKRSIFFDKSRFRNCMSNLAVSKIEARDFSELLLKVRIQLQASCDLRKQIIFDNELFTGELKTCEIF